jgi:hypothetical protein
MMAASEFATEAGFVVACHRWENKGEPGQVQTCPGIFVR